MSSVGGYGFRRCRRQMRGAVTNDGRRNYANYRGRRYPRRGYIVRASTGVVPPLTTDDVGVRRRVIRRVTTADSDMQRRRPWRGHVQIEGEHLVREALTGVLDWTLQHRRSFDSDRLAWFIDILFPWAPSMIRQIV